MRTHSYDRHTGAIVIDRPRFGRQCFLAWCLGTATISILAIANGVPVSALFATNATDTLTPWQGLLLSVFLMSVGVYLGIATRITPDKRSWVAGMYDRRLK